MCNHYDQSCSSCGDVAATPDDLADGDICYRCQSEFQAQLDVAPFSETELTPVWQSLEQ